MKTPKRESNLSMFDLFADPESAGAKFARLKRKCARWKRKNRVSQYKRTIARLTLELQREREYRRSLLAAYASLAEIARNAKQITLACTYAAQLTERKEKE